MYNLDLTLYYVGGYAIHQCTAAQIFCSRVANSNAGNTQKLNARLLMWSSYIVSEFLLGYLFEL